MGHSITLKDLPEALYQHLRAAAAANNRSIEAEAAARLEAAVPPERFTTEEHLARITQLRNRLAAGGKVFDVDEIDRAIEEGR